MAQPVVIPYGFASEKRNYKLTLDSFCKSAVTCNEVVLPNDGYCRRLLRSLYVFGTFSFVLQGVGGGDFLANNLFGSISRAVHVVEHILTWFKYCDVMSG